MILKIAVLGAGINGITCAVKIKEKYKNFEVVLISNEFSPNTTGDGSGGLWYPYLCGNTNEINLTKWGGETYRFLHKLWLEGGYDISAMPIYVLHRENKETCRPVWAETVFGYGDLEKKQLEYLRKLYSVDYRAGHTFTTFIVRPPKIIDYLNQRYRNLNGKVVRAEVTSLRDPMLEEFDVVINCTGLGSRVIVPDDKVFPIRGQIIKLAVQTPRPSSSSLKMCKAIAPWINVAVVDEDSGHYILPNAETCILGGTHQENDFNTKIDAKDSEFILNGCKQIVPGLEHVRIVNTWVGLRPGREEVKIAAEEMDGRLYVHNYGHGGSGLTLFWGCGTEVLNILERRFDQIKFSSTKKSKL